MYNIIPKLFGKENITFSFRDTDSITYKIKNCSHEKYLKIIKNNPQYYNKELGIMENELDENISEVISLRSKCYSIQKFSDISNKINKNYKLRKATGYDCKLKHNQEYFKKVLFNEIKFNKAEYYNISLKNGKLHTELQIKDDISNFNDKRYTLDNLISKPYELYL